MQDHANSGETVRLTDLTYEDWLEHAFGHEVRIQQAAWFFDQNCDWWDPEPAVALAYLTRPGRQRYRLPAVGPLPDDPRHCSQPVWLDRWRVSPSRTQSLDPRAGPLAPVR